MRTAIPSLVCALLLSACGQGPEDEARGLIEEARARLEAGDLADAERRAEQAAHVGGTAYEALHSFLRGNIAFARSLALNEELNRPNVDARARAGALAFAEDALAFWRAAAATRNDWPAARRNVERALLRIDEVREKGREKRKKPKPGKGEEPEPREARIETSELAPGQVLALLDLLEEKAKQRRQARRDARRKASARVERDW